MDQSVRLYKAQPLVSDTSSEKRKCSRQTAGMDIINKPVNGIPPKIQGLVFFFLYLAVFL